MRRAAAERRQVAPKNGDDYKKFTVGKDPLEKEADIEVLRPHGGDEQKSYLKMLRRLLKEKTRRGLVEEAKAIQHEIGACEADGLRGHPQKEFARDFVMWLHGRGKQKDHDRSWWGRASLLDDAEVRAYCDLFTVKRMEYMLKLTRLAHRRPMGINEHWLFFKFVVRNEPLDAISYMSDSKLLLEETMDAMRKYPTTQHPVRDAPHHHEVPPFDSRRVIASNGREIRREQSNITLLDEDEEDGDFGPDTGGGRGGPRGGGNPPDTGEGPKPVHAAPARAVPVHENDPMQGVTSADEDEDTISDEATGVAKEQVDILLRIEDLLSKQAKSPELGIQNASAAAAESKAQLEIQNERINDLKGKINALELSKQPSKEQHEMLALEQAKVAKYEGMLQRSDQMIDQLQEQIKTERSNRDAEARATKEMVENYLKPKLAIEGKGKEEAGSDLVVHSFEKQAKFQEDFMKKFADFVSAMNARQAQLEENMRAQGPSGPIIEEVQEMQSQWEGIRKSLEGLPANLALEWKAAAEQQENKSQALVIASNNNIQAAMQSFEKAREQDHERFNESLKNFAGFMKAMMVEQNKERQNFAKIMLEQNEKISDLVMKMPAENKTLMLEMRKELGESLNSQLALVASPAQQELADAVGTMQQVSQENSSLLLALNEAAQRAAKAEAVLVHAEATLRIRGAENQELARQVQIAQMNAANAARQAYVTQQEAGMMSRQLRFLAQQNEQIGNVMRQAEQREYQMRQQFFQHTQGLVKQIGYLQNQMQQGPIVEELPNSYTDEEKWLLRLEGAQQPLLIEGPAAQKEPSKEGGYKLPVYDQASLQTIRSDKHAETFRQVRELEEQIVQTANKNGVVLDPELAHVLSVKSVKLPVLKNKLERYRILLQSWGSSFSRQ